MLNFVQDFTRQFDIGPKNAQIGVATFSSDVHERIKLDQYRCVIYRTFSVSQYIYMCCLIDHSVLIHTADNQDILHNHTICTFKFQKTNDYCFVIFISLLFTKKISLLLFF